MARKEECEKLRDEIKAVLEELERTKLGDDRRLVLFDKLNDLYARLATVSPLVGTIEDPVLFTNHYYCKLCPLYGMPFVSADQVARHVITEHFDVLCEEPKDGGLRIVKIPWHLLVAKKKKEEKKNAKLEKWGFRDVDPHELFGQVKREKKDAGLTRWMD
mgnify:FL=1